MRPVNQAAPLTTAPELDTDDNEYEYVWEEQPTPSLPAQGPYRSAVGDAVYRSAQLERALERRDGSFDQAIGRLFEKGFVVVPAGERMAVMRLLVERDGRPGLAHWTALKNLHFVPAKARVEVAARLALNMMRHNPYDTEPLKELRNFMVAHHAPQFATFVSRIEQGLVNKTLLKVWNLLVAPGDDKAPGFGLMIRLPVYLTLLAALPVVSALRLIPTFDKAYRFFRRDSAEASLRLWALDTVTRAPEATTTSHRAS